MQYRPDIDGLRALAVLSVLFFHLGFSNFSGGFVGVDVFFVISGFLITQLITMEVRSTNAFSFSKFYIRRARRLAPALFFTFTLCFVFAVALFSPGDMERFSGALVHAVVSLSNFYFWSESGYFDSAAIIKPLLHTWSLSVEEQFYLIWPATLALLLLKTPRYVVPVVLLLAGLFSLYLNLVFFEGESAFVQKYAPSISDWFSDGAATIYYLAPFRVFEFAIGASLVFFDNNKQRNPILAEIACLLGLGLIFLGVHFYTDGTPFPSVFALPPCIGTALLIHFGRSSRVCKMVLSQPAVVRLGLISYSLYLIHWPIIVFYTYYTKTVLSATEQWTIVLASIVAAELMYRWVERPFRYKHTAEDQMSSAGFGLGCALIALAFCFVGASGWANQGWAWRYGDGLVVQALSDTGKLQRERAAYLLQHPPQEFPQVEGKRRILLVGDSLADDMLVGLAQHYGDKAEIQTQRYNQLCYQIFTLESPLSEEPCASILAGLESSTNLGLADEVYIVFSMAPDFWAPEFVPLVEYVKSRTRPGTRISLLGRRPQFPDFHSIAISMADEDNAVERIEQRAREIAGNIAPLDKQMKAAAGDLGIDFISSFDIICPGDFCNFFVDDGSLLFWDTSHFTVKGARWFGSRIVDQRDNDRQE